MTGHFLGKILAFIVYATYQFGGFIFIRRFLAQEKLSFQILIGSVLGSFALHWLPALFAFFFGFTERANMYALFIWIIFAIFCIIFPRLYKDLDKKKLSAASLEGFQLKNYAILLVAIPLFCYFFYVLYTHTFPQGSKGELLTGQATYGDMNMHLAMITSIAKQGFSPPEYSIFAGEKLSYPFLCNSISSSLYLFGASLRFAYIFPMLIAFLQCFFGIYFLAKMWVTRNENAKIAIPIIACVLFFFNGGFGFFYFLDNIIANPENFFQIFSGFYKTPTNLIDKNVRFVNTIVDMMLPQRATLFGWAMLFPLLCLLYKAIFQKGKSIKPFFLVALLISGMPLIHTHSFVVASIFCACCCLYWLINYNDYKKPIATALMKIMPVLLVSFFIVMEIISFNKKNIPPHFFIALGLLLPTFFLIVGIYNLIKVFQKGGAKDFFQSWGLIIGFILIFALPQLLFWTFEQSTTGEFLKGRFNWANEKDSYLWFYLKNLGLVGLLFIPAVLKLQTNTLFAIFPAVVLWILAEFIQFQPNPYDNNKLIYPAFLIFCIVIARFIVELYQKINPSFLKFVSTVIVLFLFTFSAILTMQREAISKYTLYSKGQVALAQFIEDTTPINAVIMTNNRHNNEIASFTGRSIFCGADAFLFFHGVQYQNAKNAQREFYENIQSHENFLAQNTIHYVVISDHERNTFKNIDEQAFKDRYTLVYKDSTENIQVYRLPAKK
ncbi:MAG: hypothetical protein ACRC5H_02055 [Treponemataceae bacterium]